MRTDTLKYLRAEEVFGGAPAPLSNQTRVLAEGDAGATEGLCHWTESDPGGDLRASARIERMAGDMMTTVEYEI